MYVFTKLMRKAKIEVSSKYLLYIPKILICSTLPYHSPAEALVFSVKFDFVLKTLG